MDIRFSQILLFSIAISLMEVVFTGVRDVDEFFLSSLDAITIMEVARVCRYLSFLVRDHNGLWRHRLNRFLSSFGLKCELMTKKSRRVYLTLRKVVTIGELLFVSLKYGYHDLSTMILESNEDLAPHMGRALILMIEHGYERRLEVLRRASVTHLRHPSLLIFAARRGDVDAVRLLLPHRRFDYMIETAMIVAARYNKSSAVCYLLHQFNHEPNISDRRLSVIGFLHILRYIIRQADTTTLFFLLAYHDYLDKWIDCLFNNLAVQGCDEAVRFILNLKLAILPHYLERAVKIATEMNRPNIAKLFQTEIDRKTRK